MSNPFAQNGAIPDKQSKYAPLYVNEFWTGLYTNRNPLREGAVPFLYQKFYSGSRFDSMIAGSNIEISPRLTPIRRFGNSVYNSQTFSAINGFYAFRVFDSSSNTEKIRVIADTSSAVYDATGPSTKTTLFTKSAGAGQTSFQSLGNTLYAADGVSAWKWIWASAWGSGTYTIGDIVLDTNNNLQKVTSADVGDIAGVTTAISVQSNVVTLIFAQSGNFQLTVNKHFTMSGVTTATFLNGSNLVVTSVIQIGISSVLYWQVTASFVHANYGPAADTGSAFSSDAGTTGTTGVGQPSWNAAQYGTTTDGALVWTNAMPSVQKWGITAPTVAPTTANIPAVSAYSAWAANTWYWPSQSQFIVDSNGNIQQLTTSGTTGNVVPVWNVALNGTTADNGGGGTAVWTNRGSATRATTTAYAIGYVIAVTWSTTTVQGPYGPPPPYGTQFYIYTTYSYSYFFQCVTAGTSSGTATGSLPWSGGIGAQVQDGSVVWTNIGQKITRTVAANSAPTVTSSSSGGGGSDEYVTISTVAGNVSNSTLVSTSSTVTGTSNGIAFKVTGAGESGAAEPTWVTPVGSVTADNGIQWVSLGPTSAANTGTWVYSFAYKNSISGHISSAAPSSSPILLAASSWISVAGAGSTDTQVDTIVIYRTTQGQSAPLFELAEISAPQSGAPWSFIDQTPDPPNTGATLNEFIQADTTGNNAPPPSGISSITYYLGRIMAAKGVFDYYSGVATQAVGVGAESFPGLNYMQFPEIVTRSWASATGLLIFTQYGVFYSQGTDSNGNPNSPVLLLEDIGLLSANCFTVNGSIPALFTSDKQLLTLDPSSGVSRVSEPIADVLTSFSASGSYLTWHTNGTDQAYFVADGSTGWYRLAPTAPPENGLTWSPKATIVGGVKCIQSIETSPGSKTLLLGPTSSGPILQRDLTTNQDNGSNFTANFTIGSLVLAQPNQCAEVTSVTTEAKALGSHPTVSVLGDEISGAFESLTTAVNDPPFLNTPSTLYPDRWYFNQLTQPAWLRHLQIKIAWPSENFANELLAFALYGCVHTE